MTALDLSYLLMDKKKKKKSSLLGEVRLESSKVEKKSARAFVARGGELR